MTLPPPRWNTFRLDELGFVGRGRSRHRPRNDPALYGGHYPFVQTGDIKAANLRLREYTQTYNETGLSQSKMWNPGTLCITIAANIAETAILDIPACFPDSIIGFKADPDKSDPVFIKYYIDYIKLRMQQVSHGTTQDNLSLDTLLRFDFIVPVSSEQRKIASILTAYDDLIQNNLRRIKILEEMAQNLYREWFVKYRFPGYENARFVDSSLGRIPERWRMGNIEDICRVIPGFAFSSRDWSEVGIPVIKIKNILPGNMIDTEQVDHIPEEILKPNHEKYFLSNGDFLIAMTGATAGKVGKLRTRNRILLNQRVAKIDPDNEYRDYVWCRIRNKEAEKEFFRLADGAAQPNMSSSQIESVDLLIPCSAVCGRFAEMVSPMMQEIDNQIYRNTNLRHTRDMILPKLISGDLDVSELDITIPEKSL